MLSAVVGSPVFAAAAPSAAQASSTSHPKAVIIVGPTGAKTNMFRGIGDIVAQQASAAGMRVTKIYEPDATWDRVVQATKGANLVVYLGHGNGWPSPYAPFQESTKDGLGLNYPARNQRSINDTDYYGGDRIRNQMRLAPNAIVLIYMSCYAAGNGEPGPNLVPRDPKVAVERVDNFASAFLDKRVGAAVVFAYRTEQIMDIPQAFMTPGKTMLSIFKHQTSPPSNPHWYNEYTGLDDIWFDSVRHPGTRGLLDHNTLPGEGYSRAITGRLDMTTDQWLGGGGSSTDTTPPVLTGFAASSSGSAVASGASAPVAFSPNGDGIDETVSLDHQLSEESALSFTVTGDPATPGDPPPVVRTFDDYADAGAGASAWDGRDQNGDIVPDGIYHVTVVATDDAGNLNAPQTVDVQVLSLLAAPTWDRTAIDPNAGEPSTASADFGVGLSQDATVDLSIEDAQGHVVRTVSSDVASTAGPITMSWDGRDDTGAPVPDGAYFADVVASDDSGTVHYQSRVWVGPFQMTLDTATPSRGHVVTYDVVATDPLGTPPRLTFKWAGGAHFGPWVMARVGHGRHYRAKVSLTGGRAGPLQVTVSGTDTVGEAVSQTESFSLR